jgi:deazaflavin-dependent oxidoreductase (nitroreductase family)
MADTQGSQPPQLPDWIRDHVRRYLETDGEDGHLWDSTPVGGKGLIPTLLLTTVGRRSGRRLTLPLIYGRSGDDYVVVASRGGAPTHPSWYLNLVAEPRVELQVKADRFSATARTAGPEERARLWQPMRDLYPPYDEYQARAGREIPVVVLRRAG